MFMNMLKWFFTSRYKKLLYHIDVARNNQQRLHLPNGVVLDFYPGHEYDNCKNCASGSEYEEEMLFRKYVDRIGQTIHLDVYDCFSGDVKVLAVGKDRIFVEIVDAVPCYACQSDPLPGQKYWVWYWEIYHHPARSIEFTENDLPF